MKKTLFLFLMYIISIYSIDAQSYWKFIPHDEVRITNGEQQWIVPQKFKTLNLDFNSIKKQLNTAPMEFTGKKPISIQMPIANGELVRFDVFESPCMQPGLSAKFPDIKSYAGYNPNNKAENIRLDISPSGVKAIINTSNGQVYLDPYARFQNEYYIVYYTHDFVKGLNEADFICGFDEFKDKEGLAEDFTPFDPEKNASPILSRSKTENLPLRTYRMAIATTGLYSKFIGTTVPQVIAELNTAVNRINMVTVKDLSVKLELVDNNDKVVFFDETTDAYTDGDLGQMIDINPSVLNSKLGSNGYDFGHVFGQKFGGGVVGLAQLQCVCTVSKGRGGSTLDFPKNDPFWIDIVAHEMGHQMGANHSFNNCGGNEAGGTAYEPGSGSTIMSYSGACGSNNVQNASWAMYNVGALEEITFYMHTGNGNVCAEKTDLGNHKPESIVDIPNGYYIPISTPFQLQGKGLDEDGDTLSYSWEEYDLGPTSELGMPMGNAPAFQVFAPQNSNTRYFPRLDKIISNQSDKFEVLPTYSRDLSFKMVVRDNNYGGGAVAYDYVSFKATELSGPFAVTYPNAFLTWTMATEETVTWDVANSDLSPVNCKKVNILLSYDGGFTYPIVLVKNTPNDGSEVVVVPYFPTNVTGARIRVEAAENIFFDISNISFTIKAPTVPALFFNATTSVEKLCLPGSIPVDITLKGFAGYDTPVNINVIGLPPGATPNFSKNPVKPSEGTSLSIDIDNNVPTGIYDITIEVQAPGLDTFIRKISFEAISTKFDEVKLLSPSQGASGVSQLPTFSWTTSNAAQLYDIEIATSPAFGNTIVASKSGILLTSYTPPATLNVSKLYFWRVRPTNECKDGDWSEINAFHTLTLSCNTFKNLDGTLAIPASGTPTVSSKITILSNGTISDVNIASIVGYHDYFDDMDVSIEAPDGTNVSLFKKQCIDYGANFNFGLDDSAPGPFSCPPNNGKVFKPAESLTKFNGKESAGEWKLIIHDTQVSGGGYINEWNLTMCSTVNLSPPFVIINDTLYVTNLKARKIYTGILEIGDPNNTPDQLTFTLVTLPKYGYLTFNGNTMNVGDKFKQSDINNGSILYVNQEANDVSDNFHFTVEDGEGGWLGVLRFDIETNSSYPNSTKEQLESSIGLYPNPVNNELQINVLDNSLKIDKIDLYTVQGLKVKSWDIKKVNSNLLNVAEFPTGSYFVNFYTAQGTATKKIIIQH